MTPKPSPKLRLRPEAKSMTICAAMMCPDGIVLCADTLETVGSVHRSVEKLVQLPIVSDELKAIVVCATDDGVFSDALIERISDALDLCNGTFASAKKLIESATLKYCNEVWKALDATQTKPSAQMLIGLKTVDDLRLLHLSTPILRSIDSWEFIGYGSELGVYKAGQYGLKDTPTAVAAPILAYILDVVKNNTQYCGRATSLAILHMSGDVEHKSQDYIAKSTQGYKSIDWILNRWVFPFLPVAVSDVGEDMLSMIGKLGEPKADWVEKIPVALQTLAARRKSILSGEAQPELTEAKKLWKPVPGIQLAANMITNSSRELHEMSAIESDVFASIEAIYPKAAESSQLAINALNAEDLVAGRQHIKSLFEILTQMSPLLAAQTLEGQQ